MKNKFTYTLHIVKLKIPFPILIFEIIDIRIDFDLF